MILAYIYLILSQLTISFSIVASRHLVKANSIYFILEVRFLFAAILLFLYAIFAGKLKELWVQQLTFKQWFIFAFQTLCAGLFFNLFLLNGLKFTSAGTAGIISSFLPSMIVVLSIFFLREKLDKTKSLSLALATLGLLLVNLHHRHNPDLPLAFWGDFLVFLSLVPEAIFYVLAKKVSFDMSKLAIAFYMTFINALSFIPFLWIDLALGAPISSATQSVLLNLLLGLTTVGFYVFWYLGSEKLEASVASLFTAVMPMGALVFSAIFLHEKIYFLQLLGMVFILFALWVSSGKGTGFYSRLCLRNHGSQNL